MLVSAVTVISEPSSCNCPLDNIFKCSAITSLLRFSLFQILQLLYINEANKTDFETRLEYYTINTNLTKNIFDKFLVSEASVFFYFSSVKAAADSLDCELDEGYLNKPITHYGKSKLLAEKYILKNNLPEGKRAYILRPCMIHGPGNKGNLNLLYSVISKGFPWPLGAFDNKRSFCTIDNLCFIINELINNDKIPSGIYNIADDEPLSTNYIIKSIGQNFKKISSNSLMSIFRNNINIFQMNSR